MEKLFSEWDDAHSGHRERLRQRVEYGGLSGMPEHEVLEFLLCYAIPRQDVNALAHRLLKQFGSLEAVLTANASELKRVNGMGEKSARMLGSIWAAVSAYRCLDRRDMPVLSDVKHMFAYAKEIYPGVCPPSSRQLCLNEDRQLLLQRELCPSRAWGEAPVLKDALSDMLASGAHISVILQFIGSEQPQIEAYDLNAIRRYEQTLRAAHCKLADVVLLGEHGCMSLRREGYIPMTDAATDYSGMLAEQSDPATFRLTDEK